MKSLNDRTEKLQMTGFQSPNTGQFNKKIPNTIEWHKTDLLWLNSTYLENFDWSRKRSTNTNQKLPFV